MLMCHLGQKGYLEDLEVKINFMLQSDCKVSSGFPLGKFEVIEYRGVELFWEEGNPMPNERLEIFFIVIDSLTDDVKYQYSMNKHEVRFYYLSWDSFYSSRITPSGLSFSSVAFHREGEIFLNGGFLDSSQPSLYWYKGSYGPHKSFYDLQIVDSRYYAMTIVHEYVHAIQFYMPNYFREYSRDVGWEIDNDLYIRPNEDSDFYKVLRSYSIINPWEDMADTYMVSYLCDNNLEILSETRCRYIDNFWGIPRDQYCKDFE